MSKKSPDRITISIPPGSELSAERVNELVADSDFDSISEFIRACILAESLQESDS